LDTGTTKNRQKDEDDDGPLVTGVGVSHSTYEGFLFQDICVGVLSIYHNLIQSLASNEFRINMNFIGMGSGKSVLSVSVNDDDDQCKLPRTVNQAVEEYIFLKSLLSPLIPEALASVIPQPDTYPPHPGHGNKYPTHEQLRKDTKVLAASIIQA
jgi:hypothetical protein